MSEIILRYRRFILMAAGMAVLLTGCQTEPLGGTRWRIVELVDPDPEDRAKLENLDDGLVEFSRDGRLITTYFYDDGTATVQDRERYRINGDRIEITHPDYAFTAMYRMDGEQLRIHSKQFIIQMNPIKSVGSN